LHPNSLIRIKQNSLKIIQISHNKQHNSKHLPTGQA
jgi:hypothetical protein